MKRRVLARIATAFLLASCLFAVTVRFSAALQPNDPDWPYQLSAGIGMLNLGRGWDVSQGVPSVRVAVFDGGVNQVVDLAGRMDPGVNYATSDTGDTSDNDGHGTMVASIIAADTNDDSLTAGEASRVHIVPVKVCKNAMVLLDCSLVSVKQGLEWVFLQNRDGHPIQVVNMSFGANVTDPEVQYWLQALDAQYGVISVAAAGNAGTGSLDFPASDSHVLAVSGVLPNGQRSPNSNYGPGLALAAPFQAWIIDNTGALNYFTGTSSAAPFISGIAALFKRTQVIYPGGVSKSTISDFIAAVRVNADGTTRGWSQDVGYGVPDAWATIWAAACVKYDFNSDGTIDVSDAQRSASRYGAVVGQPGYDIRYDVYPNLVPDGQIDIGDLQKVFGKDFGNCPR